MAPAKHDLPSIYQQILKQGTTLYDVIFTWEADLKYIFTMAKR